MVRKFGGYIARVPSTALLEQAAIELRGVNLEKRSWRWYVLDLQLVA